MCSGNWEGKGTGGADSGLLGGVHYRRNSTVSIFCLAAFVCCSDLVGEDTGGRGGFCEILSKNRARKDTVRKVFRLLGCGHVRKKIRNSGLVGKSA